MLVLSSFLTPWIDFPSGRSSLTVWNIQIQCCLRCYRLAKQIRAFKTTAMLPPGAGSRLTVLALLAQTAATGGGERHHPLRLRNPLTG